MTTLKASTEQLMRPTELTIDDAAQVLDTSVSQFRRFMKRFPGIVRPIRRSYRVVRYSLDEVCRLEKKVRDAAIRQAIVV